MTLFFRLLRGLPSMDYFLARPAVNGFRRAHRALGMFNRDFLMLSFNVFLSLHFIA
jgi:hypothetical protein